MRKKWAGWLALLLWTIWAQAGAEEIDVVLQGTAPAGFSMEVLAVEEARPLRRIYIYHTHTYEAYDMADGNRYETTETWRTADQAFNVVRVGEALKEALEAEGFQVYHDKSAYEPPKLSTAYARSLEGLQAAADEGYDLYIDLHREADSQNNGPNTVFLENKTMARVLFLVGRGDSFDGAEKPDWEQNRLVAQYISDAMNGEIQGISRGVAVKSGRYNQHAAVPCILLEAGNNQNTLTQAINAMAYVARGIGSYFDRTE